jgi:biopolymer transport protein ExbB
MIHYWLQQVGALVSDSATKAAIQNKETANTVIGTLTKGGWIMVPLGILFILTLFFFFERLLALRKASKIDGNFMNIIKDHIVNGNINAARSLSKNTDSPIARMIDKGLQRIGKKIENIDKSMESVANLELFNLEKNLNTLSSIASIAPKFGFLGTIIGMFQLFFDLGKGGDFNIAAISNGIYVKMISSATGLIIGILAYVAHKYLSTMVEREANRMEIASAEFLDVLQEPVK